MSNLETLNELFNDSIKIYKEGNYRYSPEDLYYLYEIHSLQQSLLEDEKIKEIEEIEPKENKIDISINKEDIKSLLNEFKEKKIQLQWNKVDFDWLSKESVQKLREREEFLINLLSLLSV